MARIKPWVLVVVCVVVTTTCATVHPVREGLTRLSPSYQRTVPRDGSPSRRKTPLGQTCENGSSSCYAGEQCCNGGSNGGSMCCPGNTTCCQDTCCSNSTDYKAESCCPDPKNGGVCCLTENTFCCPPNPELDQPSRCCPRWYVCCAQGRYGCCNPDTGLSMDEEEALLMKAPSVGTMEGGAALPHAYALFAETNAWTDNERLYGATVNLINASYSQVKVEVGVFHTDQEMTRRFMFRRSTNTFLLLQANFTDKALDFPITLYTINPATGASTATPVVGARDEVTGMHYVEEADKILMATWWFTDDDARHKVGYKFYTVDPETAVATLLSKVNNSDYTTLDHDTYAGWFHEASSDLRYVYRIGFASEINDIDYGLGVVDISQAVGKVLRWTALQDPRFHGRLRTLHRYNKTSPTSIHAPVGNDDPWNVDFVSLAQSNNITTDGDLALYAWNPSNVTASIRQVAQYGNAHLQAYFGPIAEAVDSSRTKYAAAVVQDSLLGDSFDTWGLAVADLVTRQSALIALSPSLLASTSSISGFGVPTSADGITGLLNKVHK